MSLCDSGNIKENNRGRSRNFATEEEALIYSGKQFRVKYRKINNRSEQCGILTHPDRQVVRGREATSASLSNHPDWCLLLLKTQSDYISQPVLRKGLASGLNSGQWNIKSKWHSFQNGMPNLGNPFSLLWHDTDIHGNPFWQALWRGEPQTREPGPWFLLQDSSWVFHEHEINLHSVTVVSTALTNRGLMIPGNKKVRSKKLEGQKFDSCM